MPEGESREKKRKIAVNYEILNVFLIEIILGERAWSRHKTVVRHRGNHSSVAQ
jgi:hypothetical protein